VPVAPDPVKPTPVGASDCDQVQCLIDPSIPCCVKLGIGQTKSTAKPAKPATATLPERPNRTDVSGAMNKLKGRLQSCADRNAFKGTVRIKFSVTPDGAVDSASTADGTAEFQSCVAGVVAGATLPASEKGITVTYPLMIR
jgi:hypothetical protein